MKIETIRMEVAQRQRQRDGDVEGSVQDHRRRQRQQRTPDAATEPAHRPDPYFMIRTEAVTKIPPRFYPR
eukprot:COSAG01_NODE_8283_length_2845_cov_1.939184_1_plen_70_part_00